MPREFQPWLERLVESEGFRATVREMQSPGRSPEEFVRALVRTLDGGRPVALADVAYVNGSDLALGALLRRQPQAPGLAAYGGWNTAGNTLGTVLAQGVIRAIALQAGPTREQRAAHLEFLFLRFLDDEMYQGRERTRCMMEDLPAMGIAPTMERLPDGKAPEVESRVNDRLACAAADLRGLFVDSKLARDVRVGRVRLPWQRLFEVGFDVKVEVD
jgi:hypothetical protein